MSLYSRHQTPLSTRWAQMTKQEQIIERKKQEIQMKQEAQKQAAALASVARASDSIASTAKKTNIFSNDGSFMNQFKKLLEKQQKSHTEIPPADDNVVANEKEKVEPKGRREREKEKDRRRNSSGDRRHDSRRSSSRSLKDRRHSDDRGPRENKSNRWGGDRHRQKNDNSLPLPSPTFSEDHMPPNVADNEIQEPITIPSLMQYPIIHPDTSQSPEPPSNEPPPHMNQWNNNSAPNMPFDMPPMRPMGPGPNFGPPNMGNPRAMMGPRPNMGPNMRPGMRGPPPLPPLMNGPPTGPPNFPNMPPNFPPGMMGGPNMPPMPPFFGPPPPNMMGPPPPNMPPNSMNNMPFMGMRPPFRGMPPNGPPPGFGPPPNMFMPPHPGLPVHTIPEPKPMEAVSIPPPEPMKIQNIPPPMPMPLNHIPKPKDLELCNIPPPPPNLSQVLSAGGGMSAMERTAQEVARNGDHWETVLKAIPSQDQNMWFLHDVNSNEYKQYKDLVRKYRADKFEEKKPTVKPEDKYEPEFSLEDDYSDDEYNAYENSQDKMIIKSEIEEGVKREVKREASSQSDEEDGGRRERKRKRKSRWGEGADMKPQIPLPPVTIVPPLPGMEAVKLAPLDGGGIKLTEVNRNNHALLQYAMTNYGSTNLSAEDWKKCEDNFKLNLLYQDMLKKRAEVERLAQAGKHKYDYDSDEDTESGTWEHKLRAYEMNATERWADELTKQAAGKHHIGDFLPPEELKKFMEKYSAMKGGKEPDLSDYKDFKLKEDNIGFKMLQKLGWNEGQGLGAEGTGIVDPVNKSNQAGGNAGLGVVSADSVSAEDDEFDAYRKRMMLAYRFRPNPLNNPRRPYY